MLSTHPYKINGVLVEKSFLKGGNTSKKFHPPLYLLLCTITYGRACLIFSPIDFFFTFIFAFFGNICFSHFSLLLQNHRPKLFLFINRKQWLIPLECYPVILQLLVPPILPYWSSGTKMVEVTLFTGEKF